MRYPSLSQKLSGFMLHPVSSGIFMSQNPGRAARSNDNFNLRLFPTWMRIRNFGIEKK
jgi:hypothetical protein